MASTETPAQTAVIAAVQLPEVDDAEHQGAIAELGRLLKTLGYVVVGSVTQRRRSLRAATILGQGKLFELAAYTGGTGVVPSAAGGAKGGGADSEEAEPEDALIAAPPHPDGEYPHADVVVVDHEISPRQARHLEQACKASVLDRSGVIVEIFHRHAQTREARLQVEIARLTYVVPRLRAGVGGHDRQRGGVGGKGAGESSLELDRRKVRDRVAQLRGELAAIEREEARRRARRSGQRRVGLVGYTNAGKSSLMRALTGSRVLVQDKLFATLGTTVRALYPEVTPRILVSDTVGFIKKLPHDLVASFRSTLDEALEASLLLYVVDCSDPGFRSQLQVTRDVLAEIGADEVPSRLLLNKIDRVDEATRLALAEEFPDGVQLSAHAPANVAALRELILELFDGELPESEILVPWSHGAVIGEVRSTMRVLAERHDERGTWYTVRATPGALERVRGLLG